MRVAEIQSLSTVILRQPAYIPAPQRALTIVLRTRQRPLPAPAEPENRIDHTNQRSLVGVGRRGRRRRSTAWRGDAGVVTGAPAGERGHGGCRAVPWTITMHTSSPSSSICASVPPLAGSRSKSKRLAERASPGHQAQTTTAGLMRSTRKARSASAHTSSESATSPPAASTRHPWQPSRSVPLRRNKCGTLSQPAMPRARDRTVAAGLEEQRRPRCSHCGLALCQARA